MNRLGFEPSSGLYFEVVGRSSSAHPVLWIHGAGATGACWRVDLEGRPGWADQLAANGAECWVTDWPGSGRSGGRVITDLVFDDLVAGYLHLLTDVIAEPVVVVCHSMGGAITWQLVQHARELVAGVVSVAGAYPANTPPTSTILEDDGRTVRYIFDETGVEFLIDRDRAYLYDDAYVFKQGIAGSTRFEPALVDALRNAFVPFSPLVVLQRGGVEPGMPAVTAPEVFSGLDVALIAGDQDPAHTNEIETRTLELLRSWGADAELVWLPDLGIEGNGHFLFWESNAAEIGCLLEARIRSMAELPTTEAR